MKKTKKELAIQQLMDKNPGAKKEIVGDRTIVTYRSKGRLCCAVWINNMHEPVYHYSSVKEYEYKLEVFIDQQKEHGKKWEENEQRRKQKIEEEQKQYQPGAILYTSWGYEQTNIDFYIVLERKPRSVVLQEIGQDKVQDGYDSGTCTPDPEHRIGEPFLKRLSKHGGVSFNSYSYCGLWDGQPKRWSSYA